MQLQNTFNMGVKDKPGYNAVFLMATTCTGIGKCTYKCPARPAVWQGSLPVSIRGRDFLLYSPACSRVAWHVGSTASGSMW
jgi:hypothetical protein